MLCIVRIMLSQKDVRLSVRPFVTRRYCRNFSPSGSHTILVFLYQTLLLLFCRRAPNGETVECTGVWKIRDFRPISCFISETIQDRAIVTMEYENLPKLSNGTIFSSLERPLTKISRSRHYFRLNISETVRDKDIDTTEYYWTYTCSTQGCNFEWPSVTLSDLAKDSMTRAFCPRNIDNLQKLHRRRYTVTKYNKVTSLQIGRNQILAGRLSAGPGKKGRNKN